MITLKIPKEKLSNARVQRIIAELQNPDKKFIRLPGESRTGICPFCAQFVYMSHDGSGREVPLPISGTHQRCVCQDIPLVLFEVGTKQSVAETFNIPQQDYRYKIRAAKAGEVKRYDWLKYQKKATLTRILGANKAGFLKDVPLEKLYNRDKTVKTNQELQRIKREKK